MLLLLNYFGRSLCILDPQNRSNSVDMMKHASVLFLSDLRRYIDCWRASITANLAN
jgi:hypothetical protein